MDKNKIKFKILRIWKKIQRRLPKLRKTKKQVYLRDRIKQYEGIWQEIANQTKSELTRLDRDIWQLQRNDKIIRLRLHQFPLDNDVILRICGRKYLSHKLISELNIPVPDFVRFKLTDLQPAYDFLEKHPNGVVVKPSDGYAGLGVTTHITKKSEIDHAAVTASLYLDDFMIENQIVGENYRLLIYKGRMLHAVRRTGQAIVGDGVQTIRALLKAANPADSLSDHDLRFTLSAQGLNLDTVPEKDSKILTRSVGKDFNGGAELRTVYDCEVTELVHPEVVEQAIQCANIVQADLVGVDIITTDITRPLSDTGGVINEINTTPALHHHYDEEKEPFPKAALIIAADLLDDKNE